MIRRSWPTGEADRGDAEPGDTEHDDVPVRDRPYESFGQQGLALPTYGEEPAVARAQRGAERVDLGEPVAGPVARSIATGTRGWTRRDDRIREDVCMHLTGDGYVDASDIEVIVHQGEVTLIGTVCERHQRERAIRIAEMTRGVIDVIGRLRIAPRP